MQLCHVTGFEGDSAEEHRVEHDTRRPNVRSEPLIALILKDFRGDVGRCTALLGHTLTRRDELGHSKITDLDITL